MIRVSVLYPGGDDVTFDHDYYKNTHVPLACAAWNVGAEIDKGLSGPNLAVPGIAAVSAGFGASPIPAGLGLVYPSPKPSNRVRLSHSDAL